MLWLVFSTVLWALVHSFLASLRFKDFAARTLGNSSARFYRLLYNLFAGLSLLPVLYLMVSLPDRPLYEVPAPWSYLMLAGELVSILLLLLAVLQTDALSFLGIRQLLEEQPKSDLVITGFYRLVRHPLYTFSLLALWLSPAMTVNILVVYVAFSLYFVIGAVFEERKLLREYGQQYADYKARTPMLVPGLRLGSRRRANRAGTNHSPGSF